MKKTGFKTAIVVVLSVLVVGGLLFAGPRGPGRGGRPGAGLGLGAPGGPRIGPPMQPGRGPMPGWHGGPGRGMELIRGLYRLDLTEEQRELIGDILEAGRDACEAGREAVADAAEALHTAVTEGADEAIIREAATNLGTALGDQAVLKASTIASVKEVLTEEQLQQLQEMKDAEPGEGLGGAGRWGGGFGRGRFHCSPGRGPGGPGRGAGMGLGAGFGLDRLIENVDTDGDGTLTAEELEAFKESMKARPRW